MYNEKTLRAVGRSAGWVVTDQSEWIHRRVETLSFPQPDDVVVRRHLSVDFTIPAQLRPAELELPEPGRDHQGGEDWTSCLGSHPRAYYVPLSLLRKWPPVPDLDLRVGPNEPAPLLTRRQNGITDSALLQAVGERVLRREGLLGDEEGLPEELLELISPVATGDSSEAAVAVKALGLPLDDTELDEARRGLMRDRRYANLIGGLERFTILWLRVSGLPHERHIVKFSYNARATDLDQVSLFSGASFGWKPFELKLKTPHIGDAGSYHLQFSVPAPVSITAADVEFLGTGDGGDAGLGERSPATTDTASDADGPPPIAAIERESRRTHLYVSGSRPPSEVQLKMKLLLDKGAAAWGAAVASFLVTVLLAAYGAYLGEVLKFGVGSLGLLFVVPGFLAYLVVRPGEHAAAGRLFKGVRMLVLLSALLPLLAALGILLSGGVYRTSLDTFIWILAGVGGGITVALTPSLARRQPGSHSTRIRPFEYPPGRDSRRAEGAIRELADQFGDDIDRLTDLRKLVGTARLQPDHADAVLREIDGRIETHPDPPE